MRWAQLLAATILICLALEGRSCAQQPVTGNTQVSTRQMRIDRILSQDGRFVLLPGEACSWVLRIKLSLTLESVTAGAASALRNDQRVPFLCDAERGLYAPLPDTWTQFFVVYTVDNGTRYRRFSMPQAQPLSLPSSALAQNGSVYNLIGGLRPLGEPIDAMLSLFVMQAEVRLEKVAEWQGKKYQASAAEFYTLLGQLTILYDALKFELGELERARLKRDQLDAQLDLLERLKQDITELATYETARDKVTAERETTTVVDYARAEGATATRVLKELADGVSILSNQYKWRPGAGTIAPAL